MLVFAGVAESGADVAVGVAVTADVGVVVDVEEGNYLVQAECLQAG